MLLLRHASAGDRLSSASLDRARRLDRGGRADARLLPEALAGFAIDRIVTSPHARCVETVRALALGRGLETELRDELVPDVALSDTLRLLDALPDAALVCTHREVIEGLLTSGVTCEKGGTWLLARQDNGWSPEAYLLPPSQAVAAREAATLLG